MPASERAPRPRRLVGATAGLVALVAAAVATPLATATIGQAAGLRVTAAPLQTWVTTDLPTVRFPETADLIDCGDLAQYDELVQGTSGNDVLDVSGARGNTRHLVVGLDGDDTLVGGNQDDCLVGGAGDDTLRGGNGRDVLVGGSGADHLDGGSGQDVYRAGGDEGDRCTTGGAPDTFLDRCGPDGPTPDADGSTGGQRPDGGSPPDQERAPEPVPGGSDGATGTPGADRGSDGHGDDSGGNHGDGNDGGTAPPVGESDTVTVPAAAPEVPAL